MNSDLGADMCQLHNAAFDHIELNALFEKHVALPKISPEDQRTKVYLNPGASVVPGNPFAPSIHGDSPEYSWILYLDDLLTPSFFTGGDYENYPLIPPISYKWKVKKGFSLFASKVRDGDVYYDESYTDLNELQLMNSREKVAFLVESLSPGARVNVRLKDFTVSERPSRTPATPRKPTSDPCLRKQNVDGYDFDFDPDWVDTTLEEPEWVSVSTAGLAAPIKANSTLFQAYAANFLAIGIPLIKRICKTPKAAAGGIGLPLQYTMRPKFGRHYHSWRRGDYLWSAHFPWPRHFLAFANSSLAERNVLYRELLAADELKDVSITLGDAIFCGSFIGGRNAPILRPQGYSCEFILEMIAAGIIEVAEKEMTIRFTEGGRILHNVLSSCGFEDLQSQFSHDTTGLIPFEKTKELEVAILSHFIAMKSAAKAYYADPESYAVDKEKASA